MATLEVGSGKTYTTIQSAITASKAGDTISIASGTYNETIIVNKGITITGAGIDQTIINGINGLDAIQINSAAGTLTISGLTVNGTAGASAGLETAALYIKGANGTVDVNGCKIVAKGDSAITVEAGASATLLRIRNNTITGNTYLGPNTPAQTWSGTYFSAQYSTVDIPRQLVVINSSTIGAAQFTGNILGDGTNSTGALDTAGIYRSNTVMTCDAPNVTISGNIYNTACYSLNTGSVALRVRGNGCTVSNNTFVNPLINGYIMDNKTLSGTNGTNNVTYSRNTIDFTTASKTTGYSAVANSYSNTVKTIGGVPYVTQVASFVRNCWEISGFTPVVTSTTTVTSLAYIGLGKIIESDKTTLLVSPNADYSTIASAITDAVDGNVISVAAGTYNENLTLNKSLKLRGAQYGVNAINADGSKRNASETIIQGPTTGTSWTLLHINADDVEVDGFTVRIPALNTVTTAIKFVGANAASGVEVERKNINIRNNILENLTTTSVGSGQRNIIVFGESNLNATGQQGTFKTNNVLIEKNFIDYSSCTNTGSRCITATGSHYKYLKIENTSILNNRFILNGSNATTSAIRPFNSAASGSFMYYNTLKINSNYFNTPASTAIAGMWDINGTSEINNNTFVDCATCMQVHFYEAGAKIQGNTFTGTKATSIVILDRMYGNGGNTDSQSVTVSGNTFNNSSSVALEDRSQAVSIPVIASANTVIGGVSFTATSIQSRFGVVANGTYTRTTNHLLSTYANAAIHPNFTSTANSNNVTLIRILINEQIPASSAVTVDKIIEDKDSNKLIYNSNALTCYDSASNSQMLKIMQDAVDTGTPVSTVNAYKSSTGAYTEPVKPKAASGILSKDLFVTGSSDLLALGITPSQIVGTVSASALPSNVSVNIAPVLGTSSPITVSSGAINIPDSLSGKINPVTLNNAVAVSTGQVITDAVGNNKVVIAKPAANAATTIPVRIEPNNISSSVVANIVLPPAAPQRVVEIAPNGIVTTSGELTFQSNGSPMSVVNMTTGTKQVGTDVSVSTGGYALFTPLVRVVVY